MSEIISDVIESTYELIQQLRDEEIPYCDKIKAVNEQLEKYSKEKCSQIKDFSQDLEWFNVSRPLTMKEDLKGKVILLDFFTYCCINCLHILPDLKRIEKEFSVEDGVVVVGIHSAKFDNEKDSANLLSAIQRYEINHPVVNDSNAVMWNQLSISFWPTLLILSPSAQPLFLIAGEGFGKELHLIIQTTLSYFKQFEQQIGEGSDLCILEHSLPIAPAVHLLPPSILLFPGKVACHGDNLAISDSGHHRVLIASFEGTIKHIIGGSSPGFVDGNAAEARFNSPQGVVFYGPNIVFVADTENHAIRKIDLSQGGKVITVAGVGVQGNDKEGGKKGTEQLLNSPWDLCIIRAPYLSEVKDENQIVCMGDVLLIAMAGSHQIWAYFLEDTQWWRGKSYLKGQCVAVAGSGLEENRNNAYPHAAGFAQPSGIASSPECLFISDSESSSIRRIWMSDGKVTAVVGGNIDPQMLFAFGDIDGKGRAVRLQHPLGVAFHCGNLYVADTYNHKLKVVHVGTTGGVKETTSKSFQTTPKEECKTLLGTGHPGEMCGDFNLAQLNEPGGLCLTEDGCTIFIADTNNHCIKKVDLTQNVVTKVSLSLSQTDSSSHENIDSEMNESVQLNQNGGILTLIPKISLGQEWDYTQGAPMRIDIIYPKSEGGKKWPRDCNSNLSRGPDDEFIPVKITVPPGDADSREKIKIKLRLFVCSKNDTCHIKTIVTNLSIIYSKNSTAEESVEMRHTIL